MASEGCRTAGFPEGSLGASGSAVRVLASGDLLGRGPCHGIKSIVLERDEVGWVKVSFKG